MEVLPPELVTKILSFLDPASIVISRQVCTRWRILAGKMTNPLYVPCVMSRILQNCRGRRLRDFLKLRLVCKLWKDGLDHLSHNEVMYLNGLTSLHLTQSSSLTHLWNPFPSRLARVKLYYGHDNPEAAANPLVNIEEDLLLERFGEYVHYLQISVEHSHCAEHHVLKVLNYVRNLKGLVISERPSPFRFANHKKEDQAPSNLVNYAGCDLSLENLQFLKLDDSDGKLKYIELYKRLIELASNLKHLEMNGYYHLDMGIMRLLSERQPPMSLTQLKLDVEDPHTLELLEILNKTEFPLKYLSLKVNGFGDKWSGHISTELLHNFLKRVGTTLQRLELKLLWYDNSQDGTDGNFPEILRSFPSSTSLPNLERLKLVGYKGQLDFLTDLVSLKYLMIVNYDSKGQERFVGEESFYEGVPKLKAVYLPSQHNFQAETGEYRKKVQNFMHESDPSFIPKNCGLFQGFP